MGQECAFPHRGRCLEGYTAADLLPKPTAHLRCGWVNWLRQAAGPTPTLPAAPHRQRVPFGLLLGITQPQTLREGAPAAALWDTAGGGHYTGAAPALPQPHSSSWGCTQQLQNPKDVGKRRKTAQNHSGAPGGGGRGGTPIHPSIRRALNAAAAVLGEPAGLRLRQSPL